MHNNAPPSKPKRENTHINKLRLRTLAPMCLKNGQAMHTRAEKRGRTGWHESTLM